MVAGAHRLEPSVITFPDLMQGAESEMEQPGLKLVLIMDANVVEWSLTCIALQPSWTQGSHS